MDKRWALKKMRRKRIKGICVGATKVQLNSVLEMTLKYLLKMHIFQDLN